MKDWFSDLVINLPQKEDYDDNKFIKVKEEGQNLVFMNFEKTIGLATKQLPSPEYLDNIDMLTWDEFRKRNIENILSEKPFYQAKYIKKIVQILQCLNYGKADIVVYFPKIMSPVMFVVDGSDVALFLAPCKPRSMKQFTSCTQTGKEEKQ